MHNAEKVIKFDVETEKSWIQVVSKISSQFRELLKFYMESAA